jgi:hypothetical protein
MTETETRTIRLLVEENGEKLWRCFEGRALAGTLTSDGAIASGRNGSRGTGAAGWCSSRPAVA